MSLSMPGVVALPVLFLQATFCFAQTDTIETNLKLSAYADVYYCYDFGNPENHTRPSFVYSYNRHNEVNVNLAYAQLSYSDHGMRSKLALMAGTYAQYNLAHEPPIFQHVMEASVGIKLSKQNVWIDAGIMPSHLGLESPVGINSWNLTRSISADNSPYYETGIRISYADKRDKWQLAGYLLNGWQKIQRAPGNQTPAFGTQVTYKTSGNATLNWSSYEGNDFPDSAQRWRYFNDFYGVFYLSPSWSVIAGIDVGIQQTAKHSQTYDAWYAPLLMARYSLSGKSKIAARVEYFGDKHGVIIRTGTPNGFKTSGYSINYDLFVNPRLVWRNEARLFISQDAIFLENKRAVRQNYFLTTTLCLAF